MSRDDKFLKFFRAFQGNHPGLGLRGNNINSAHCFTQEAKYMNLVCQSSITYGHYLKFRYSTLVYASLYRSMTSKKQVKYPVIKKIKSCVPTFNIVKD